MQISARAGREAPAGELVSIVSEVAPLRQVVVHTPGEEMSLVSPHNKQALLFDDILFAEQAREEHQVMCRLFEAVVGSNDAVIQISELLAAAFQKEEARAEFERAVELNPQDAESLYHLGCFSQKAGDRGEAIRHFQDVLRSAPQARRVAPDLLRKIVRDTLERLFDMHDPEGGLDFLPWPIPDKETIASVDAGNLRLLELDFSQDSAWETMTDLFIDGNLKRHLQRNGRSRRVPQRPKDLQPAPFSFTSSMASDRRISRNRPCPCGSGKKYKKCCAPR
jgi:tetratricopeptide (TPR) repeat protein